LWHKALKDLGNEWTQATAGRAQLRIYPGGVSGDDPDMVRKMRIGQLQAGALTTAGLATIDPAFELFSVPLFFASYEEYRFVLERMAPLLRRRLEDQGFVALHWGTAGWVHLFSKVPVRQPSRT